jgi:hypothetical protein
MRTYSILFIAVISLSLLPSCSDTSPTANTFTVSVEVNFPQNYASSVARGATVTLTSTTGSTPISVTSDSLGIARFVDVIPGTYDINATRTLTPTEAQALTGIVQAQPLPLSARLAAQRLDATPAQPIALRLSGSALGSLVIKEVYYSGSRTPAPTNYFRDQFLEIYNNSTDTVYTDSLYIADLWGASGQISPGTLPTPFAAVQDSVFSDDVWMIPGNGRERPLAPGASLVIALTALNHRGDPTLNPNSPSI